LPAGQHSDLLDLDNGGVSGAAYSVSLSACSSPVHSALALALISQQTISSLKPRFGAY
jgi:hypothetical protein